MQSGNASKRKEAEDAVNIDSYNRIDLSEHTMVITWVIDMKYNPTIKICVHNNVEDGIHVSGRIAKGEVWENSFLGKVQRTLNGLAGHRF